MILFVNQSDKGPASDTQPLQDVATRTIYDAIEHYDSSGLEGGRTSTGLFEKIGNQRGKLVVFSAW
jgi:hypothetical protein